MGVFFHKQILCIRPWTWILVLAYCPYFTLSSLRWSMTSAFLLSARIFFFFSLSVCFFAPFLPSCWKGGSSRQDVFEKEIMKERDHRRGSGSPLFQFNSSAFTILHVLSLTSGIAGCFSEQTGEIISKSNHNHRRQSLKLLWISKHLISVCDDWPSAGLRRTAESCLSEPSSSWRPRPASFVPPPAPSSLSLPVVEIVQNGHRRRKPPVHSVFPSCQTSAETKICFLNSSIIIHLEVCFFLFSQLAKVNRIFALFLVCANPSGERSGWSGKNKTILESLEELMWPL